MLFNKIPFSELLRLFFLRKIAGQQDRLVVCMWHEFHKPPYGGGNQFFIALKKAFEEKNIIVVNNILSPMVDVHLCNSIWFDVEKFERLSQKYPIKMIQRIDGPVSLYRGEGSEEDEKIHTLTGSLLLRQSTKPGIVWKKAGNLGSVLLSL